MGHGVGRRDALRRRPTCCRRSCPTRGRRDPRQPAHTCGPMRWPPCRSPRRSSRCSRSTAAPTGSTSSDRLLERLPDALAADGGAAMLEIGADQGDAHRRPRGCACCPAGMPASSRISPGSRGSRSVERGTGVSLEAGAVVPHPADRPRHRRHPHRRRRRPRSAHRRRRSAAALRRGIAVSLVTGRMATSAMRFARALGLTEPIVAYQGGLIRAMPPAEHDRGWGGCSIHRAARRRTPPARIVAWARDRRHGPAPQPPRAVRDPGRTTPCR